MRRGQSITDWTQRLAVLNTPSLSEGGTVLSSRSYYLQHSSGPGPVCQRSIGSSCILQSIYWAGRRYIKEETNQQCTLGTSSPLFLV